MTIDTTKMCSHLQRKLFDEDGVYHRLWMAMQDDPFGLWGKYHLSATEQPRGSNLAKKYKNRCGIKKIAYFCIMKRRSAFAWINCVSPFKNV